MPLHRVGENLALSVDDAATRELLLGCRQGRGLHNGLRQGLPIEDNSQDADQFAGGDTAFANATRIDQGGLVVDERYRSQAIGPLLLARAEKWARKKGCCAIGLRSNVIRDRAHAFYERHGYKHIKTQKAFHKDL